MPARIGNRFCGHAADIPVEEAARYELVLNQATATALQLTLPLVMLARADEVIE